MNNIVIQDKIWNEDLPNKRKFKRSTNDYVNYPEKMVNRRTMLLSNMDKNLERSSEPK